MNRYLSLAVVFALGVGLTLGGVHVFDQHPSYEISHVKALWAYDISDPELVADDVDNIFIGRVTASKGQASDELVVPISLWEVEVKENLKGELPARVIIAQRGGFNEEEQKLLLLEGDQLLAPGTTVLLAVKYSEPDDWFMMTPSPAAGKIPEGLSARSDIRRLWVDAIAS